MTLLFSDGFDHYNTSADHQRKWDANSAAGSFLTGRFGGNAMGVGEGFGSGSMYKTLPANASTIVCGCAMKISGTNLHALDIYDGTTVQVRIDVSSAFSIYRGDASVTLATGVGGPLSNNNTTWYYVEFKVVIHASAGAVTIKVNGTQVYNATSLNTQATANAYGTRVRVGGTGIGGNGAAVDDLYLCDGVDATATQGVPLNDFLAAAPDGLRISYLGPTGAGTTTQFTPSAGSNYQCVDDVPSNDDTDYVSSGTVGNTDTYAMADLPSSSGTVRAVQTVIKWRKDDAGTRSGAAVVRSGGTNYVGATVAAADTYGIAMEVRGADPATSAAWTPSGVNAMEIGQRVAA